jgi:predicted nucleic acid-binding protein
LDTNIIIDFLNREQSVIKQFNKAEIDGVGMLIPSVVDYEIMRGFCHTPSPRKEVVYQNMRVNCPVIEINTAIWKLAASIWALLRKAGQTVGDADIIIAATCIENGYSLITYNTKHFKNINGLLLCDWVIH